MFPLSLCFEWSVRSDAVNEQEILISHAAQISRVTQVRSTLLQASIQGLKRQGIYDAWLELVAPAYRQQIIDSIGPSWLPVEAGVAHYQACDKLQLGDRELEQIGNTVGERLQGTLVCIAGKVVQSAGVTLTAGIQGVHRLWPRLFTGGSMQVTQTGKKDIVLEVCSAVLTRTRYFRGAFCGNVLSATKLFGVRAAHVKVLKYDAGLDRFTVQLSWV